MPLNKSDFYYDLPQELIAQTPLERRDGSRMMTLSRETGKVEHRHFFDLPSMLRPGDCLVLNDSRVIPARLLGVHAQKGSAVEVLLLRDEGDGLWDCITRPGKRTRVGDELSFGDGKLTATVESVDENGNRHVRFHYDGIFLEIIEDLGRMPLPPYITEQLDDPSRYQTVYARNPGSAAAPTAGLHFTPELLASLEAMGVSIARVTLHVGLGTFRPVKADVIEEHHMHAEYYEVSQETADLINRCRAAGGRIISVGTTSTRTLESVALDDGTIPAKTGWTDIFIYPGYRFKAIDGLITNFHLPESTLIMLVSAFAGYDETMAAYREAVAERYRFFSFGDCMFIS
ncbi:MAG: tRNA preQ1(34) S-adenosylmethionine ribosyltransferase-isomerase QueA [Ruminococcaceae bacterium]|nr:tRNA preQ1(34) S-adenosylmethionine ribosyltransferase-isomerase QueA [Oscillospiraceae bacterium]